MPTKCENYKEHDEDKLKMMAINKLHLKEFYTN